MTAPEMTIADTTPTHDANALTADGRVARIRLNGPLHARRIPRQGKLLLTKSPKGPRR